MLPHSYRTNVMYSTYRLFHRGLMTDFGCHGAERPLNCVGQIMSLFQKNDIICSIDSKLALRPCIVNRRQWSIFTMYSRHFLPANKWRYKSFSNDDDLRDNELCSTAFSFRPQQYSTSARAFKNRLNFGFVFARADENRYLYYRRWNELLGKTVFGSGLDFCAWVECLRVVCACVCVLGLCIVCVECCWRLQQAQPRPLIPTSPSTIASCHNTPQITLFKSAYISPREAC